MQLLTPVGWRGLSESPDTKHHTETQHYRGSPDAIDGHIHRLTADDSEVRVKHDGGGKVTISGPHYKVDRYHNVLQQLNGPDGKHFAKKGEAHYLSQSSKGKTLHEDVAEQGYRFTIPNDGESFRHMQRAVDKLAKAHGVQAKHFFRKAVLKPESVVITHRVSGSPQKMRMFHRRFSRLIKDNL